MSTVSTTASSASTFKIGGLVSGLDTNDIISQLMGIENKPLQLLEYQKSLVEEKLTAWRSFNTRIQAFKVQTANLGKETTFQSLTATSSDESMVKVSTTSSSATGVYNIKINQMAQAHQMKSQEFATLDTEVGTGTISFAVGGITIGEPIEITSENNTLTGMRDAINESGMGVIASIIQTGTDAYRLIVTSDTTGTAGEITPTISLSGGTAPAFTDMQSAQDAEIQLGTTDPITITKSSNTISDVIPGVTLNLQDADPAQNIVISVSADTSSPINSIKGFITQYNNLVSYFDEQFTYDVDTNEAGTLFSDTDLLQIKNDLYEMVTSAVGGDGKYQTIFDLGLDIDAAGQLVISDTEALETALADSSSDVLSFFTDSENGFSTRLNSYIDDNLNDSTNGIFATVEGSLSDKISSYDEKIAVKEDYIARVEENYYSKFSTLETTLAKLQSQSEYLNSQFSAMENSAQLYK